MGRSARERRKPVELFNFSFLDVFACVIGLLIFILSIVVASSGPVGNPQSAGRLSNAEHQFRQAKTDATAAARRRQRDQALLDTYARDLADPKLAADAIHAEIALLDSQTEDLHAASDAAAAHRDSLQEALAEMGNTPTIDPAVAAMQQQLRALDEQTAAALNDAQRPRLNGNTRVVQYNVPRVHSVHRRTLWVEIEGDRVWRIGPADYDTDNPAPLSTTYTRRADAPGVLVRSFADGASTGPAWLDVDSSEYVIEAAVHGNGYAAYRQLRQWAWAKGFEVNWTPQEEDSITLTRTVESPTAQ